MRAAIAHHIGTSTYRNGSRQISYVSDGGPKSMRSLMRCGIFTHRIFASAQRLRVLPALAHRSRLLRLLNEHVLTSG